MTAHFTMAEFSRSDRARELGLDNTPPESVHAAIMNTMEGMERVRECLGFAVIVLSGYRSKEVNKAVGGSSQSQHILGEACDFICPKFGFPSEVAKELEKHKDFIKYDQLIYEKSWVHISFGPRERLQALTLQKGKFIRGIV
jgi:zinc D-Ala-D-Ala carboxypeptidase